jgi:hypothetical protein
MASIAELLQAIKFAAVSADESHGYLRGVVSQARAAGVSWQLIGETLGVSRQAAQQRFKDVR